MPEDKRGYEEYQKMYENDVEPVEVYRIAKANGLSELDSMAMLKKVYKLSLIEVKEVSIQAYNPSDSLESHQANLVEPLQQLIDESKE